MSEFYLYLVPVVLARLRINSQANSLSPLKWTERKHKNYKNLVLFRGVSLLAVRIDSQADVATYPRCESTKSGVLRKVVAIDWNNIKQIDDLVIQAIL